MVQELRGEKGMESALKETSKEVPKDAMVYLRVVRLIGSTLRELNLSIDRRIDKSL